MEAIVMGARAAEDITRFLAKGTMPVRINLSELPKLPAGNMDAERDQLRHIMTDLVGVIRNEQGLKAAIRQLAAIGAQAEGRDAKTADMALVARMIAVSALNRTGKPRRPLPRRLPAARARPAKAHLHDAERG